LKAADHLRQLHFSNQRNREPNEICPSLLILRRPTHMSGMPISHLSERFHHFAGLTDRPEPCAVCREFIRLVLPARRRRLLFITAIFPENQEQGWSACFRPTAQTGSQRPPREPSSTERNLGPPSPVAGWNFWYITLSNVLPPRQALLQQVVHAAREDGQQVVILQLPFQGTNTCRGLLRSHCRRLCCVQTIHPQPE